MSHLVGQARVEQLAVHTQRPSDGASGTNARLGVSAVHPEDGTACMLTKVSAAHTMSHRVTTHPLGQPHAPFKNSSLPASTRPSTPTPSWEAASSLAMNTAATVGSSTGFFSASCRNSSVMAATWPRQSVVPRPRSFSPVSSRVSSKGGKSQVSGLAGTTSRWQPTKPSVLVSDVPGYLMITLPRPSANEMRSTTRGPPLAVVKGSKMANTWSLAQSSRGLKSGGAFCNQQHPQNHNSQPPPTRDDRAQHSLHGGYLKLLGLADELAQQTNKPVLVHLDAAQDLRQREREMPPQTSPARTHTSVSLLHGIPSPVKHHTALHEQHQRR